MSREVPFPPGLGWDDRCAAVFAPWAEAGLVPARVARVDRGAVTALTAGGEVRAGTALLDEPLAVGDWVALDPAEPDRGVVGLVERRSAVVRRDAGGTARAQVLAANVDHVLLLHPLDGPPNLRRIERELVAAWDSGARPAVVLTKADRVDAGEAERWVGAVEAVAPGVDVLAISVVTGAGLDRVAQLVGPERTVVLLGPSGAGKSSLANALAGEERQEVAEVRARDRKGRHTTVASQLVPLAGGGLLIDTPGLRALALWDAEEGLGLAFPDVDELAEGCRFADCEHASEPDCAVRAAVEEGTLSEQRLESWRRLRAELRRLELDRDARAKAEERRRTRPLHKAMRRFPKRL